MIKTIIDYVNYHYQLCENIDSFLLTNNFNTDEYYFKSGLIYKYLYELYFRNNITLNEVMSLMDLNSDFYFISNSNVLKNHLIFHYAFKNVYQRYKKGRFNIYIFDTRIKSSIVGFLTGILYWFFHKGVV